MRGALIWLALGLTNCSYAFVTGPTRGVPQVDCTETYSAPAVDGLITAGLAIGAIAAFANNTNNCNPQDTNQELCVGNIGPAVGTLLLIPTAIFAVSTIHGVSAVGACREQRVLQQQKPQS